MTKWLYVTSCVHLGAKECQEEAFIQSLKTAQKLRAEIALIGDLLDMGIMVGTKHAGAVYDQKYGADEQIEQAVRLLKPVRSQIVAILQGNHEERLYRSTGIEANRGIARELGCDNRYYGPSRTLNVGSNAGNARCFIAHGCGASDFRRTLLGFSGMDAIVLGHTHELKHEVATQRHNGKRRDVHLVRAGTYLQEPRYGRLALYPPNPIGAAWLSVGRNGIQVDLGVEPRV